MISGCINRDISSRIMEVTKLPNSALVRLHLEPCLGPWETRWYLERVSKMVQELETCLNEKQNNFGLEKRRLSREKQMNFTYKSNDTGPPVK